MVSFVFLGIIIAVVISSLSLLSLLSIVLVPSSSSSSSSFASSLFPSAFASIPSLDKPTTITGDPDSNSRSTTNNANDEQVTNNNNNNTNDALRTYTNTALNLAVQYPPTWGVMELKTNTYPNSREVQRSSPVPVIISPLENQSDKFQEKMLIGVQDLLPSKITLQDYTKSNLNSYRNQSDNINILESGPTTLGRQPAHKIVYTEDSVNGSKLKKIQVWTVVNNSKAYVITFGSEESKYKDYLSDAQNILSSFKITGGGRDNSSQEQRNHLTFDDPMFGIKLEYPSSWTKTQPGLPLDNRTFAFIASFIAPRPTISVSENENENENENNSSSNSSAASINVGINDLARFISGKTTNSPSSFNNNNTSNTGNRDLTLAEYSSRQLALIKQIGAELRSSIKTTVAGLPGQQVYYAVGKGLLIIQAWTLNEGKAYHIVLSANDPDDFMANLPVFHEVVKSIKFDFN